MTLRQGLVAAVLLGVAAGCSGPATTNPRAVKLAPDTGTETKPKKKKTEPPKPKEKKPPVKPAPPPENPKATPTDDEGVLSGRVVWKGPVPAAAARESPEAAVMVRGKKVAVRPAPRVEVDPKTGGLANVVVYLAKAPAGARPELVRLVQARGAYRPYRVRVAVTGAKLELSTTDDRAEFQVFRGAGGPAFGATLAPGRKETLTLGRPGLVRVRSPEHDWMTPAYVRVLDHGYAAVTERDGTFRLPGVPPGEYELRFWHEGWRGADPEKPSTVARQQAVKKVTLGPGKGAHVEWTVSAR